MKKIFTLVTLITAAVAVSTTANAQATSPVAASGATIVAPITIVKDVDLNFGNVAVSAVAGTVVLATDGARTSTGGITLPVNTGTVAAAKFTVGGQDDYTYTIALPTADITLNGTGTNTTPMTLTSVVSLPATTGKLTSGTQTLLVGGTLNVIGGQLADVYSNTTGLTVTVNYN